MRGAAQHEIDDLHRIGVRQDARPRRQRLDRDRRVAHLDPHVQAPEVGRRLVGDPVRSALVDRRLPRDALAVGILQVETTRPPAAGRPSAVRTCPRTVRGAVGRAASATLMARTVTGSTTPVAGMPRSVWIAFRTATAPAPKTSVSASAAGTVRPSVPSASWTRATSGPCIPNDTCVEMTRFIVSPFPVVCCRCSSGRMGHFLLVRATLWISRRRRFGRADRPRHPRSSSPGAPASPPGECFRIRRRSRWTLREIPWDRPTAPRLDTG